MPKTKRLSEGVSLPHDFTLSPLDLFESCVALTPYFKYWAFVKELLLLAQKSLVKPALQKNILQKLQGISVEQFGDVIHILHCAMFIDRHLQDTEQELDTVTPVADAVNLLLLQGDFEQALSLLPTTITDVLTAHPVDMDRGLVGGYKQTLEILAKQWTQKKQIYPTLKDLHVKLEYRAELNALHTDLKNTMMMLLHTSNYRIEKIKPESEQRHLSRAVKSYERLIVLQWSKLIAIIQQVFLNAMLQEFIKNNLKDKDLYIAFLDKPHSEQALSDLKSLKILQEHSCYTRVLQLPQTLRYRLETWRADMDGNPFVSGETMALSTAYSRKRCFERLSADEAVIRYNSHSKAMRIIEKLLSIRLSQLEKTGTESWKNYIRERKNAKWDELQIYSGLAYFRMVELTEAAEIYSRVQADISLLKEGYADAGEFLEFTLPLEDIEHESGIQNGFWQRCRDWVKLRDLSLGMPHLRKGEEFHVDLIDQYCKQAYPGRFFQSGSFASATLNEQKIFLEDFPRLEHPDPQDFFTGSSDADNLYKNYSLMIQIDNTATLIQSDSGSELSDIYLSVLLMRAVSILMNHRGSIVVLCESEASMHSAISLMNTHVDQAFFEGLIMMCAGSDNQKKLGPFYSAYLNCEFMKVAAKRGIRSFFGVGDSPLRSSTHDLKCDLKTLQPGSRKLFFSSRHIHSYLSNRLATQIRGAYQGSYAKNTGHDLIFKVLSESLLNAYKSKIKTQTELHETIKSIAEIVTTYFSRPSKKLQLDGFAFDQIRAIDSARAQLIVNTFDPQLAGFQQGITEFFGSLKKHKITKSEVHQFFNLSSEGQSLLETLNYLATMLDDDLPTNRAIRTVSSEDIQIAYKRLSGKTLNVKPDAQLRLARLVWQHVTEQESLHEYKAQTLLLFGANWMV